MTIINTWKIIVKILILIQPLIEVSMAINLTNKDILKSLRVLLNLDIGMEKSVRL